MLASAYRARWVLPIDRPPIENGWVDVVDGRVVALGQGQPPRSARDLGDVALLPGLVNAHTHLELSWMAGLVPPAGTMGDWLRHLLGLRRAGPAGGLAAEHAAAVRAAASMRAAGTVAVGDVSNQCTTPRILYDAGLRGVVFHELLGFAAEDPPALVRAAWRRAREAEAALGPAPNGRPADQTADDRPVRVSVVAHAPYSVSPALFVEIARRAGRAPLSVHLAESPEEIEFLRTGRGPLRDLLEAIGAWTEAWQPPSGDPVQYLADLGYLRPGVLIAHGVYLTDDALDRLRRARAVVVTCPRSNIWVGAGPPRLAHFYASGVAVAVGTDSLASSPTLSVFDELAEMRRIAPEVAAASLLDSATRVGALALGLGRDLGTIAPGKRATFVAADVPAGTTDVEEYLVGGVPASSVRPITG
jgi:cytosine/adenosine deaminase-related metal-dependent hydrolase